MRRLCFVLLAMMLSSAVIAAPLTEDEKLHKEAGAALKSGQHAKAILIWGQAYFLKTNEVYLFNVGYAYQQLGKKCEAAYYYRRFLHVANTNVEKMRNAAEMARRVVGEWSEQCPIDGGRATSAVRAAWSLEHIGRCAEAVKSYDVFIKESSNQTTKPLAEHSRSLLLERCAREKDESEETAQLLADAREAADAGRCPLAKSKFRKYLKQDDAKSKEVAASELAAIGTCAVGPSRNHQVVIRGAGGVHVPLTKRSLDRLTSDINVFGGVAFGEEGMFEVGLRLGVVPIKWSNTDGGETVDGFVFWTNVLAEFGYIVPLNRDFDFRVGVGTGLTLISGLAAGNPYTIGKVASGVEQGITVRVGGDLAYWVHPKVTVGIGGGYAFTKPFGELKGDLYNRFDVTGSLGLYF